jgi:hypothetical protein
MRVAHKAAFFRLQSVVCIFAAREQRLVRLAELTKGDDVVEARRAALLEKVTADKMRYQAVLDEFTKKHPVEVNGWMAERIKEPPLGC